MGVVDIVLLLLVGAAVFLAVRSALKRKGSCGCGCENCPTKCAQRRDTK